MKTLRLRVTMREVVPPVVRVLDVPAGCTLGELHDLLQVALGWANSHLHQFVADGTVYSLPSDDDWQEVVDERNVLLKKLPTSSRYEYDFGDAWDHDIEVLGAGGEQPALVYGEGACPPEDCGGPHGYERLLAVLADPQHPEHEELKNWAGELPEFDQAATHDLVVRTVGIVPASVRLLLELITDGVKVTPRGRFTRVFVREFQEHRPAWGWFGPPANIEEDLYPLYRLHEAMRGAGLLKVRNGRVYPTKAAADDLGVLRRLRAWVAKDRFAELLLGDALALLIARGPMSVTDVAAEVHVMLSPWWHTDDGPVTADHVRRDLRGLGGLLEGLDLIDLHEDVMEATPAAAAFLPRATHLAQTLSDPRWS